MCYFMASTCRLTCMNLLCLFNILFKMKNDASSVLIASFDTERVFLWIEWQWLLPQTEIENFILNVLHGGWHSMQTNVCTRVHADGMVHYHRNLDFAGSLVKDVLFQGAFVSCHQASRKGAAN